MENSLPAFKTFNIERNRNRVYTDRIDLAKTAGASEPSEELSVLPEPLEVPEPKKRTAQYPFSAPNDRKSDDKAVSSSELSVENRGDPGETKVKLGKTSFFLT